MTQLKEFLVGYIRASRAPAGKDDFPNVAYLTEIGTNEKLEVQKNETVYILLDTGVIKNEIFKKIDSDFNLIMDSGEIIAPEKIKVIGKL